MVFNIYLFYRTAVETVCSAVGVTRPHRFGLTIVVKKEKKDDDDGILLKFHNLYIELIYFILNKKRYHWRNCGTKSPSVFTWIMWKKHFSSFNIFIYYFYFICYYYYFIIYSLMLSKCISFSPSHQEINWEIAIWWEAYWLILLLNLSLL